MSPNRKEGEEGIMGMTREQASNVLDDYDVNFAGHTAEEIAEAFDVAFKALEQQPCKDAISRQDAIDCVSAIGMANPIVTQNRLKNLPRVNPVVKDNNVMTKLLEDIKAEIWEYKKPLVVNGIHYVQQVDVVDIIDKYKSEE